MKTYSYTEERLEGFRQANRIEHEVAKQLQELGIDAEAANHSDNDYLDGSKHYGSTDIAVKVAGETVALEVKCINFAFDNLKEAKNNRTIGKGCYVDEVDAYERKEAGAKIQGIVMVSKRGKGIFYIPAISKPYWTQEKKCLKNGPKAGQLVTNYKCPPEYWETFETLADDLKRLTLN